MRALYIVIVLLIFASIFGIGMIITGNVPMIDIEPIDFGQEIDFDGCEIDGTWLCNNCEIKIKKNGTGTINGNNVITWKSVSDGYYYISCSTGRIPSGLYHYTNKCLVNDSATLVKKKQ